MRHAVLIPFAGLAAFTVAASVLYRGDSLAAPAPFPLAPTKPYGVDAPHHASARFSATTSCAAAACHGSGNVGQPGGEQSTWAATLGTKSDPHRRAYSVLFNKASTAMVRALGSPTPAHENALCLKCHALDADKHHGNEALGDRVLSEGVSCDACHGASAKWLAVHYEAPWQSLSPREKFEHYGFKPTKNLVARTMTCVACHVGAADREVNHDLIAAGHPRLAFESARFHFTTNYLKHWTEKTPQPSFELRAWYIGQWVNLRAAVALLESRARRASQEIAPWPEFSEGSCYACHHPVGQGSPKPTTGRLPGSLPWQTWNTALVELLPQLQSRLVPEAGSPALTALEPLRREMTYPGRDANGRPRLAPDAKVVAELAARVTKECDAWLARLQEQEDRDAFRKLDTNSARTILGLIAANALSPDRASLRDNDWDFLAQHYLGCVAAYHAAGGRTAFPTDTADAVHTLERLLQPPATSTFPELTAERLDAIRKAFQTLAAHTPFRPEHGP